MKVLKGTMSTNLQILKLEDIVFMLIKLCEKGGLESCGQMHNSVTQQRGKRNRALHENVAYNIAASIIYREHDAGFINVPLA